MPESTSSDPTFIAVNGRDLSIYDVFLVAKRMRPIAVPSFCVTAMRRSRAVVDKMLQEDRVVYGITTGFGFMKDRRIAQDEVALLQRNLITSHAAGVGAPLETPVVRALMLLRINALVKGYSGIRPEVVALLVEMLNRGVHPIIPGQGSVGASGDLAPLAHSALVLMGLGRAEYKGELTSGLEALRSAGLTPIELGAKEGLALINGTQAMGAIGCLALEQARLLAKLADVACACSLEALLGTNVAYQSRVHLLRPHGGQMASARNLTRLSADSPLMASHKDCGQVQDGYSLRCAPQVHGASRDAIAYARQVFHIEINSVTDNPLIFPDQEEALSAGHFHGQPVAMQLDFLAIALAELGNISERRVERLVNPALSNGLPPFLSGNPGLNSGLMVAQYAAAALVSENKIYCHPGVVDSIPTSAGQEDHVSMGMTSARKLTPLLANVFHVLAIELMCAMQGLHLRGELLPGRGVLAAYRFIRGRVPPLGDDRVLSVDIESIYETLLDGSLVAAVEEAVGPLE
jgi:histidine ammonia-lyase